MMLWARGPWGPLGPRCRIRLATVTTYCQAGFQPYETCTQQPQTCTQTFPHTDYLLSGKATYSQAKLPTVRQATYSQACTQPIHRHAPRRHRHAPKTLHRLARNNRIHARIVFTTSNLSIMLKYIFYLTSNLSIMLTYICYLTSNLSIMLTYIFYLASNLSIMLTYIFYLASNLSIMLTYSFYLTSN